MTDTRPTTPLPSGQVTFVMTDIEGSTALLRRLGEAYARVVFRHRELVSAAVRRHHGVLFGHEGDSCLCVFANPVHALTACLEAQAALGAERWPEGATVAVRIGVHTGEARVYVDNYVALSLHQAVRVAAAGHGGQVLVSARTEAVTRGRLPRGSSLRDLGSFRLKDFPDPEHLFQLCHPGLRSDFPLLRTFSARSHNLPRAGTSFIGRVQERARLAQLLHERRIVTVTGPGGVGKTRLALEVGGDLLPFFPDGVWLVELAAAQDFDTAVNACAAVLGVAEERGRPLLDSLAAHLDGRCALLILDNCEHLSADVARLAASLSLSPELRVLITTREALRLSGEQSLRIAPLPLQEADGEMSEAMRLFVERVQAQRADFVLDAEAAAAVAEICQRLEGMPLALELAASRARSVAVTELAARLRERFRLLAGGPRDAGQRHQTLRETVQWTYELLPTPERVLFERLAVFADGWDLGAAVQVCAGEGLEAGSVQTLLDALVEKSLVTYTRGFGEPRYGMLETLRDFAGEKLRGGDSYTVQRRLLDWATQLVEAAVPQFTGPDASGWLNRLVLERDNLRAALEVGLRLGAHAALVRLTAGLTHFWIKRGRLREGIEWAAQASAVPSDDSNARAQLLVGYGRLLRGENPTRAESLLREALALPGIELPIRLEALKQLTTSTRDRGDYAAAEDLLIEQAELLRSLDDRYRRFIVETELATLMLHQGRAAEAVTALRERLAETEAAGWRFDRARLLNNLAIGLIESGEHDEALSLATEGADIFRELGSLEGVAHVLSTAGLALLFQDDLMAARRHFVEVGRIALEVGSSHLAPEALERLAMVELRLKRARIAARYAFAADTLYTAVGYEREPADRRLREAVQLGIGEALDADSLVRLQVDASVQARAILAEAIGAGGR